jgi:hypothetical protein
MSFSGRRVSILRTRDGRRFSSSKDLSENGLSLLDLNGYQSDVWEIATHSHAEPLFKHPYPAVFRIDRESLG